MRKILRLLMLILMFAWGTQCFAANIQIQAGAGEGTVWEKIDDQTIKTLNGDITLKRTGSFTTETEGASGVWKIYKNNSITITSNVGALAHIYISFQDGNSHGSDLLKGNDWNVIQNDAKWESNGCWCASDNNTKSYTLNGTTVTVGNKFIHKTYETAWILWIWIDYVGPDDTNLSSFSGSKTFDNDKETVSFGATCKYTVSGTSGANPINSSTSATSVDIDHSCYVSACQLVDLTVGDHGTDPCNHRNKSYARYSKTYEKHFIKRYKQTVSSSGYATFCHYNNMVVPSGCTAYTYKTADGKSSEVTTKTALVPSKTYSANSNSTIPAGEAVIVKASAGDYYFTNPDGDGNNGASKDANNDLSGNSSSTQQTTGFDTSKKYYYLMYSPYGDNKLGFYYGKSGGSPIGSGSGDASNVHKAWLVLSAGQAAKGFTFYLPDDDSAPTAIGGIRADNTVDSNALMYNAAGQRVGSNYKGIVIQNGRKFLKR